jgi:hypothetical protein
MRDSRFPNFDEALNQLDAFLDHHQARRPSVRWIFREDVALRERSLVVSTRLNRERKNLVEGVYSRAVANAARGIVLSAEGIDNDAVYCTLYVSISEDDAEGRLIDGLKLSMLDPLLPVVIIDQLAWARAAEAQMPQQLITLDDRFQRIG